MKIMRSSRVMEGSGRNYFKWFLGLGGVRGGKEIVIRVGLSGREPRAISS